MTRPSARLVAVVIAAAWLLTGCSGLATTSPVQPGLDVNGASSAPLQFVPPGPQPGAAADDIVRGFLRAGTASDGNYDVARTFLTAAAAKTWVPDNDAVVYDGAEPLTITDAGLGRWRLAASQVARVETDGSYLPSIPGSPTTADITVTRTDGQWRIASLPDGFGRWVSSLDAGRLFAAYRVNYLAVDSGAPVPDLRWFPQDHLPTRLAKALLDDVPPYLVGTARSAMPADATVESVPVKGGVATVDLTGTFSTDTSARRAVWTQVVLTLAQLPEVDQVMVQSDGATLDYAGKPAGPLTPADVTPANGSDTASSVLPVLRNGGTVTQVNPRDLLDGESPGRVTPDQRRTYPEVGEAWKWLALAPRGAELAATDDDQRGLSRWRNNNQYVVPVSATSISRPAYDAAGVLWFGGVGATPAQRLWAVDSANPADPKVAAARPVTAAWLAGRVVVAVAPSSDKERLAVVSTDSAGKGTRLDVTGVIRAKGGFPAELSAPLRVGAPLARAGDLTWIDDTTLALVAAVGTEQARPYVVSTGGEMTGLSSVPGATAITTLSGQRDLVVTSTDDMIRIRAGVRWLHLATGSDFAVAPG